MLDATQVERWIADDPDEASSAELQGLLADARAAESAPRRAAAQEELADRFAGPLEFGTAGLRGKMGAGPNRMNSAVVIRTTAGLLAFLKEAVAGLVPRVVIGYDARHGSQRFASQAAAAVAGCGGVALLLPATCPTPVLAFAVRHLDADAGVMITASHNPPQDNGYKVYLGGRVVTDAGQGAQIVSPYDEQIAAHIAAVGAAEGVARSPEQVEVLGEEVEQSYLERVSAMVPRGHARALRIVYTPMHGVGGELALQALHSAGFTDVHAVPEQAAPDPDFPTLVFPNPEEPGAMNLALQHAQQHGADLIIANDPDADRCSVAVPDVHSLGGWRQLTGDELGALLGVQAANPAALTSGGVLASSVVSSRLLAKIAASHGLRHETTLTGFKWISRVPDLVYGYEEALGYCVDPAAVRDKDGISAAVRTALLASQLRDRGMTLVDALDELALTHGLHATAPLTLRVSDVDVIGPALQRLRHEGLASLAGSPVVRTVDLASEDSGLPPTDGLVFTTADDDRVVIRPSGTEPKLKCYLEVVFDVPSRIALPDVRREASERLDLIRSDLGEVIDL